MQRITQNITGKLRSQAQKLLAAGLLLSLAGCAIPLKPNQARVTIYSDPPGATISGDAKQYGTAPVTLTWTLNEGQKTSKTDPFAATWPSGRKFYKVIFLEAGKESSTIFNRPHDEGYDEDVRIAREKQEAEAAAIARKQEAENAALAQRRAEDEQRFAAIRANQAAQYEQSRQEALQRAQIEQQQQQAQQQQWQAQQQAQQQAQLEQQRRVQQQQQAQQRQIQEQQQLQNQYAEASRAFEQCVTYWYLEYSNLLKHVWVYKNQCNVVFDIQKGCPGKQAYAAMLVPTGEQDWYALANCPDSGNLSVQVEKVRPAH